MPLKVQSAEQAYKAAFANKARVHPFRGKDEHRMEPFPSPVISPSFSFDTNSSFFATGSCFARNIENALYSIDANVVSSPTDIRAPEGSNINQLFNKYTIHSILNEITWALTDQKFNADDHLVEVKNGEYVDLQISPTISGSKEEMLALRQDYNDSFRAVKTAEVLIVTLGLVECWFDNRAGVYVNLAPTMAMIKRHPDRFEFHVLSYEDVYNALQSLYKIIQNARDEIPKMLFTVSPVALQSTFREHDVLTTNCYSKSVQRAALEAFIETHDADYFPSYEMVTLSDNRFVWTNADYRHVQAEAVERIMSDVFLSYAGPSFGQARMGASGRAKGLRDFGDYEGAVKELTAFFDEHGDQDAELLALLGDLQKQLNNYDAAAKAYSKAIILNPENPKRLERNAEQCVTLARLSVLAEDETLTPQELALHKLSKLSALLDGNADLVWLSEYIENLDESLQGFSAGAKPLKTTDMTMQDAIAQVNELDTSGEFDQLIAKSKRYLKVWPDCEMLRWRLSLALAKLNHTEEAIKQLDTLIKMGGSSAAAASRTKISITRDKGDQLAVEVYIAAHKTLFPDDKTIL